MEKEPHTKPIIIRDSDDTVHRDDNRRPIHEGYEKKPENKDGGKKRK